jgi:hypothetical protein
MGWWERRKRRIALQEEQMAVEAKILEAAAITTSYVDPSDALRDPQTGEIWDALGLQGSGRFKQGPSTVQALEAVRSECRHLAVSNPFAANGHENRISYIVGSGHAYTVVAKPRLEVAEESLQNVQELIDEFIRESQWHQRQQEIVRRMDRDGECFLRFFQPEAGAVKVRFVEPDDVKTPENDTRANATFGIVTDKDDVETVIEYLVDGDTIKADEIQHRKQNVDGNVKRGLPTFYPVRANLRRAERLLNNMTVVANIQSAIALIRKHGTGSSSAIEAYRSDKADVTVNNQTTGKTYHYQRYQPGTILDVNASTEYDFPAKGIDAGRYVTIVQAELRAIASRLVMPEFMLSSDASNANYSSTMVAEGPAVKMFQRLQWAMIEEDLEVMDRVLDAAVMAGRIDQGLRDSVIVVAEPPRVETRNRREEVEADMSLVNNHIMSKHTAMLRQDLDPEAEEERIAAEREKNDPFDGVDFGPKGGEDQADSDDEDEGEDV